MKLSEAIRAGAKMGPQVTGRFFHNGGTCALGSACAALGFSEESSYTWGSMLKKWPILRSIVEAPERGESDLADAIWGLNDAGWSREAIAEWVGTVEDAQERATLPATERSETGTAPESSDVATTRQIESAVLL